MAIKFTSEYGQSGQWIERVVFKNDKKPAGPNHPMNLPHELGATWQFNVVQNAACKRHIKGGVGERQNITIDLCVGHPRISLGGSGKRSVRNVHTDQLPYRASQETMHGAEAAANIKAGWCRIWAKPTRD